MMRGRIVAWVTIGIVAAYLGVVLFGPRDNPIATAFLVVAMPIAGVLGWSLMGATLFESASWAVPLLIWQGAIFAIHPPDLVGVGGLTLGAVWLAAFFSWSPVVAWWYARVLRRRPPVDPDEP